MNKKLFKQIKNEWKPNLWLYMELFLVSVVMWYIVDFLYVKVTVYNQPNGFDISHCYLINTSELTEGAKDFNQNDSLGSEHVDELMERLSHNPAIEAVGIGQNSYPYNWSNSSTSMKYDTLRTDGWVLRRYITPGFIRVFRYSGINGESPEQLASKLESRSVLATDNLFHGRIKGGLKKIVGKQVFVDDDSTQTYTLAASVAPIKYDDFTEMDAVPCIIITLPESYKSAWGELCIRVRPEYDVDFANKLLQDSPKKYNIGNLFISNVRSFEDIKEEYSASAMSTFRAFIFGMSFLLLNIFLGLLGTYWFRTQQRRGEIALWKSFGSTNMDVYSRLICEGLIIFTFATIPAIVVDYNLAHADITETLNGETFDIFRFAFSVVTSYLLVTIMMIIGISIPARKAMKIDPAEALHEE